MPTVQVLDEEQKTFEEHLPELLGTAAGKWVLIHDREVLGTFESRRDAINQGFRTLGNVPFLVKEVTAVDLPEYVSHVGL
jgi:hypothetical protein